MISLTKGQTINLSKDVPIDLSKGLSQVMVGLGWDPIKQSKGGFFSKSADDIDCDAFAVVCDMNNKVTNKENDVVYFSHKRNSNSSVCHGGDNLTGDGDGDDETIDIDLTKVNNEKVVIAVNIYRGKSRKQHFGMLENAFIRLVNKNNNAEMCSYKLDSTYNNAITIIFGELYKDNGSWQFKAVGEAVPYDSIGEMVRGYFN